MKSYSQDLRKRIINARQDGATAEETQTKKGYRIVLAANIWAANAVTINGDSIN